MDELEFRRTLYADPNCTDDVVLAAIADDPKKQAFYKELKQLDKKMQHASQVKVPDDLVHKLIMRQTMQSHKTNKARHRIQLAMAASVAFVVGVSFTMWQQNNLLDLSKQAIAHVHYEGAYALDAQENISLQQVNAKLAQFGGEFSADIGRVYYANFCDFENVRSLHMVLEGENGKVSVFVVPHDDSYLAEGSSRDTRYISQAIDLKRASIIVVGEEGANITKMKQQLNQNIRFSA
ncbi:DUF3379 domain-containing protein [Paraglaciecola psychrophila]|jgi:hypothetical protein|uniref:DUF3379 domain-containing protein n=1 Tax=Paraglaciecola psychrophila 170 TaxID=1129794 RepID=K7AQ20_9ALTE|nr:DUF3379 domain-containing protein [Paraglaciecola psychrophila]AGH43998.1 hypothetical protein C427_1889 [Paraglaciecola psychrophila 170]GAC37395.1 hypothetical protein GPSY_1766 [Paraglaciecola psychrophila 170]